MPVLYWQFEKLLISITNIQNTSVIEAGRWFIRAKLFFWKLWFFFYTDRHLEEFPTLLHCAARFGLKNLAAVLLKHPEAAKACKISNTDGDVPASIAEKHGHKEIRELIKELLVCSYAFSFAIHNQVTMMFPLLKLSNISFAKPCTL